MPSFGIWAEITITAIMKLLEPLLSLCFDTERDGGRVFHLGILSNSTVPGIQEMANGYFVEYMSKLMEKNCFWTCHFQNWCLGV